MSAKRSGCRGCLVWMLCLFGLALLAVGVAAYFGRRELISLRDQYTQTEPMELPAVRYSREDLQSVQERVDQFLADARNEKTDAQLVLSANDINALLYDSQFRNHVYVGFTNTSVVGLVSVPIDSLAGFLNRFGVTFLRGRYLNGTSTFEVGSLDGQLTVKVTGLTVNGRPLPEQYMKRIRQINFAQQAVTNSLDWQSLSRLQRVAVSDGWLILDVGSTNQNR